jgi:arginine deiminase
MRQIFVPSEISPLKRVITHRPDRGIARVNPKRAEEMLFDDIVFLPKMQKEHDTFTDVLKCFVGAENVLETETLIREALELDPERTKELIHKVAEFEELPDSFHEMLQSLAPDVMAKVLISGYYPKEDFILFDPIPNFIFTRDIAAIVNDHVIITKASKEARHRENLLARFIFWAHPSFGQLQLEQKAINLNDINAFPPSKYGERVSIEGGDIMILNPDYLLVGCSERTTDHGFHSLKNELFKKNVIDHVVQVFIPTDRSFMHIDTIFTQINHHHIVAYKPIVIDGLSSYVHVHRKNGTKRHYSSIKEFFISEINPNIEFILAGKGHSPYQEREQWTDGCNLFTIKPGVAITYDRNPFTELALVDHGYQIMSADNFIQACQNDPSFAETLENTIISLPSNELSRARGGSHCMTCPIERAPYTS